MLLGLRQRLLARAKQARQALDLEIAAVLELLESALEVGDMADEPIDELLNLDWHPTPQVEPRAVEALSNAP